MTLLSHHSRYAVLLCLPGSGRDASCIWMTNIFERIPGVDLSIRYPAETNFRFDEIKGYDLVVCLRDVRGPFAKVLRTAKENGVKTGYAIDDNLVEYSKIAPLYKGFRQAESLAILAEMDFIICPNPALAAYYGQFSTCRVLIVPTNVPKEDLPIKVNALNGPIVIGYFGNPKGDIFSMIAETLREILHDRQNIFIVSSGVNLNSYGVPSQFNEFTPDYRQALSAMKLYRPHILLAPNSLTLSPQVPNVNLEYKSMIKLLDATRLGGVLLASRLGPFQNANEDQGVTTVENTVDGWKDALWILINEGERRKKLYRNARRYLIDHHESASIARRTSRDFFPRKTEGILAGLRFWSSV